MRGMRNIRRLLALAAAAIAAATLHAQSPQTRFDVLIRNGRIVDGTGAPWFRGDVAINGDRIAAVGPLAGATAAITIDATNLVVAPGFIDLLGQSEVNVLVDGPAASKILPAVTTQVTGEGSAIAPVNDRMMKDAQPAYTHFGVAQDYRTAGEYFKRLEGRSHTTSHVGTLDGVGGGQH